jgi:site-specific DNA-cytosine methylase
MSSQSFSGLNSHKDAKDPRNYELLVALSELDRCRADHFFFENVTGFKYSHSDEMFNEGDLQNMVQFLIKALLHIGYVEMEVTGRC